MKRTLLAIVATLSLGYANAQMKLGNNPTTTNSNALLELETTNKGLLLPRVALTSTTSFAPLTAHVVGMSVYNTATAGDVTPGYYYNNGTAWVRVGTGAGTNLYNADGTLTGNRNVAMGTNNLAFTGTGMIGIGTTDPKNCMHILCEPTATSNIVTSYVKGITLTGKGDVASAAGPGFYLENTDNPTSKKLFKINYTANGASDGYVNFQSVSDDASAASPATMAITHSGKVGIGTITPAAKLDVNGQVKISGGTPGVGKVLTSDAAGLATWEAPAAGSNLYSADGTLAGARTVTMGANNLSFTGTGNVGIGTSSPSTRLHIAGVSGTSVARIEHAGGGGSTADALQAGINNCGGACGQGTGRNLVIYNANGTNTDFASLDFVANINPSSISASSIQGIDRDATNNYAGLSFLTRNATNYASRMVIRSSGNVGIGTSAPTATLHVVGTTLAAAWSTSSDARLKTNIVAVEKGLDKVMQLQAVAYDKKESLTSTQYDKKEIGFIAQDLRKVLPTVVQENGKDKLLSVNYTELIPVLTKAIQEQQAQIEALKKENAGLKVAAAKVSELESQMSALNAKMELFLKAASTTTVTGGGK